MTIICLTRDSSEGRLEMFHNSMDRARYLTIKLGKVREEISFLFS